MSKVKFGDIVREVKVNVDRENNPYEFYVAGDHMDSEDLTIRRKGRFDTDDVGPAFTRIFKPGQILYGSRRTYLKKVAVADFEGICANTTFVLESKDPNVFCQELLPFIMLSDEFSKWSIGHSKGSTNPYVLFSDLAGYEFDLPSIEEQKVLADKLWAAYKVKESYRQLLSTTDEMLKAKFQEMFDFQDLDLTNPTNDFDKYCFDATSSATKIPAGNYLDEGKYAIYDQGQEKDIAGFTNTEDGVNKDYPVILFGDHSRVIKFINEPFFIGADGVKIIRVKDEKTLLPYFLFYDLLYHNIPNTGYNRHFKYIKMLKLTVPPMELQQQFVDIATQAEATKASLRASIEAIDRVIRSLINQ
jgi:type I restriction enzyme S subunit